MTEKINQILLALVGLPLTRTTRAANMECLKFGTLFQTDKNGETYNVGELELHLQCPWRLANDNEIIVGNGDLYEQADEGSQSTLDMLAADKVRLLGYHLPWPGLGRVERLTAAAPSYRFVAG